MSCYSRHLIPLMRKAGADPTPENRRLMDQAVRKVLAMERADCPEVWKRVKELLEDNSGKRPQFENDVIKELVKLLVIG